MEVRQPCQKVTADSKTLKFHMTHLYDLFASVGIIMNILAISGIIWRRNIMQRYWASVMWFLYNIVQAGTLIRFRSNRGAAALTFFYKFSVFGQLIAITLIVLYTTQLTRQMQENVVWYKRGCQLVNAVLSQNRMKIALLVIIFNIISSAFIPILPLFALVSLISLLSFIILAFRIYVLRRKSAIARMHLNNKVAGYYSITFVLLMAVNTLRLVIAYSWDLYVRYECPSKAVHRISKYCIVVNMFHLVLDPLIFMLCHQHLEYRKVFRCMYYWCYGACFESEQDPRHWNRRIQSTQEPVFYIHGRDNS